MTAALSKALRAAIARPRSPWRSAAMTFCSVIIPFLLRYALDRGAFGAQFAFIYPAALAIAILCGTRWALLSGVSGMMITFYAFVSPASSLPADWSHWAVLITVVLALSAIIFVGSVLRSTVNQLNEANMEVQTLNGELLHRSKNAFQMVQALASGARRADDPAAFYAALEGRLHALASANQLLKHGEAKACSLQSAIASAIQPFDTDRISVSGPDCPIAPTSVVALSLAVHELATNATKYGALSDRAGNVSLTCEFERTGTGHALITWRELDGPPVKPPARKGMGTRLLVTQKGLEVLEHQFAPSGVLCRLRLPKANDP